MICFSVGSFVMIELQYFFLFPLTASAFPDVGKVRKEKKEKDKTSVELRETFASYNPLVEVSETV